MIEEKQKLHRVCRWQLTWGQFLRAEIICRKPAKVIHAVTTVLRE